MRAITDEECHELEQSGKYQWEPLAIHSYSTGGYFTLPDMGKVTCLMFQCLRCHSHHVLDSCSNCDATQFVPRSSGVCCSQCERGFSNWKCPQCGTDNPVPKTMMGLTKKGGFISCFVASAVYESYDAPEVLTLQAYRDAVLLPTFVGRCLVRVYYLVGPTLAWLPLHCPWVRGALKQFVFSPLLWRVRERMTNDVTKQGAVLSASDGGHLPCQPR